MSTGLSDPRSKLPPKPMRQVIELSDVIPTPLLRLQNFILYAMILREVLTMYSYYFGHYFRKVRILACEKPWKEILCFIKTNG